MSVSKVNKIVLYAHNVYNVYIWLCDMKVYAAKHKMRQKNNNETRAEQ